MAARAGETGHGPEKRVGGGVAADVGADAGGAECVPVGDVALEPVRVVLGVLEQKVAHGGANVRGEALFERDSEMVWHLARFHSATRSLVSSLVVPVVPALQTRDFSFPSQPSSRPHPSSHVLRRLLLLLRRRYGQATHQQKQQPLQRHGPLQHGRRAGCRGRGRSR